MGGVAVEVEDDRPAGVLRRNPPAHQRRLSRLDKQTLFSLRQTHCSRSHTLRIRSENQAPLDREQIGRRRSVGDQRERQRDPEPAPEQATEARGGAPSPAASDAGKALQPGARHDLALRHHNRRGTEALHHGAHVHADER